VQEIDQIICILRIFETCHLLPASKIFINIVLWCSLRHTYLKLTINQLKSMNEKSLNV